jgi:hypothetical protein
MTPMFEAGLKCGRDQGLDQAMDCILNESEFLSGEALMTALNLHRRLMHIRFPKSTTTPAKSPSPVEAA